MSSNKKHQDFTSSEQFAAGYIHAVIEMARHIRTLENGFGTSTKPTKELFPQLIKFFDKQVEDATAEYVRLHVKKNVAN